MAQSLEQRRDVACLKQIGDWIQARRGLISLWELMKAFDLSDIYRLGKVVTEVEYEERVALPFHKTGYLSDLLLFREACEVMGLASTSRQIDRLERLLRRDSLPLGEATSQEIKQEIAQLEIRFQEETESIHSYHLDNKEQSLYSEPTAGWQAVLVSFGSTLLDVEESSRCMAVGRYTATVFHSMRILESGLTAMGAEFGVTTDRGELAHHYPEH